jgi:hypothetical protein
MPVTIPDPGYFTITEQPEYTAGTGYADLSRPEEPPTFAEALRLADPPPLIKSENEDEFSKTELSYYQHPGGPIY